MKVSAMSYVSILRYSELHDCNITDILMKAVSEEIKLFGYVRSATIVHYPALHDTPIMKDLSNREYKNERLKRLPIRDTIHNKYVQLTSRYISGCILDDCSIDTIEFLIDDKNYTTKHTDINSLESHFKYSGVYIIDEDQQQQNILGDTRSQRKLIMEFLEKEFKTFPSIPRGGKASSRRYFMENHQISESVFDKRWKELASDNLIKSKHNAIK